MLRATQATGNQNNTCSADEGDEAEDADEAVQADQAVGVDEVLAA